MKRIWTHTLLMIAASVVGAAGRPALAQEEDAPRDPAAVQGVQLQIPDEIRELMRRAEGGGFGAGGGGSISISSSTEGGVTRTEINENGKKTTFREGPDGIQATFVDRYGPEDADRLEKDHPDVFMTVSAIPETSGDAKVRWTIEIDKTVTVANADELLKKYPALHAIYLRAKGGAPAIRVLGAGNVGERNPISVTIESRDGARARAEASASDSAAEAESSSGAAREEKRGGDRR